MRRPLRIVLVLVSLGGAYWAWAAHPLVADRAPGRLETAVASRLVLLSIPGSARAARNPHSPAAEAWRDGARHFQAGCAFCHGTDGRATSPVSRRMYPPVPDLGASRVQEMSDGELFAVIQNGVRWTGMPAFRAQHSSEEIWELVSFIRRVPLLTAPDLHRPDDQTDGEAGGGGVVSAAMDGTAFIPADVTVTVGQTVTWTNKDPFPHNVSSRAAGFSSPDLQPGSEWRFRPEKEGHFPYVCTLHPGMKGTLVVSRKQEFRR